MPRTRSVHFGASPLRKRNPEKVTTRGTMSYSQTPNSLFVASRANELAHFPGVNLSKVISEEWEHMSPITKGRWTVVASTPTIELEPEDWSIELEKQNAVYRETLAILSKKI